MIFIRKIKVNCGIALMQEFQDRYNIEKIVRTDNHYIITFSLDDIESVLIIDSMIDEWNGSVRKESGEWQFLSKEESDYLKVKTNTKRR